APHVPGRQRRGRGARGLVEGGVPGQDDAHHPEGLAPRVGMVAGAEVDGLAAEGVHQAAVELEVLRGDLHLEGSLPGRFSGLEDLERGDLLLPFPQPPRDLEEHAPALDRPPVAPAGPGGPGGRDRGIDVGPIATGDLAETLSGRGVPRLEVAPGPWRHEGAADEVLVPLLHGSAPHQARPVSRARSRTASKRRTEAAPTRIPPVPAAPAPPREAAPSAP